MTCFSIFVLVQIISAILEELFVILYILDNIKCDLHSVVLAQTKETKKMQPSKYIATCVILGIICFPALVVGQCGGSSLDKVVSSKAESLSTFATLANGAGLLGELSDMSVPVHIFIPNNAAWNSFLDEFGMNVKELALVKEFVKALLSVHAVVDPGNAGCGPVTGSNLKTLLDQPSQTISVTPSTVADPDRVTANILEVISVKNGQLYVIDSVLSSSGSNETALTDPEDSIWFYLVNSAILAGAITGLIVSAIYQGF